MHKKPIGLKVIIENIPAQVKIFRQWLLWRYEERDGKWTKVPYQISGALASVTNPQTWNDFDAVVAAYENGGSDGTLESA